jgi:negative regulator of sigma E activity
MHRVSVAAAVALLATTPSSNDLLLAAISAPSTVSYTGVVQVVRMGSRAAEASVYHIEHRAPELTRRDYSSPSAVAGDAIVSRGDMSFSIDARRHRIVETRNAALEDRIAIDDNYALLRQNYQIAAKADETFDGRRCAVLMLINKYNRRPRMLVRIDRETKVVLDKQEFSLDGSLMGEVRFEQVTYTSSIPASDFALPKEYQVVKGPTFGQPPQDPRLVVGRAGFAARAPRTLPEGFAPIEGSLVDLKGVRTVHLLYSDGIRTFSLFENGTGATLDTAGLQSQWTSVGQHRAQYAESGAMALLAWSDATLHYALVGELTLPELKSIAAAVGR